MARYKAGHKEQARATILEAASRRLKKSGFDGVGVDAVMAEAGMTSGAFYSNFPSKERLFEEVLQAEFARIQNNLRAARDAAAPNEGSTSGQWLAAFARHYLRRANRECVESGCVLPALTADVSRAGTGARQVYESGLQEYVAVMASGTVGETESERQANAWQLLATLVGAVTISRALPDGPAVDAVLEAALSGAQRLVRP